MADGHDTPGSARETGRAPNPDGVIALDDGRPDDSRPDEGGTGPVSPRRVGVTVGVTAGAVAIVAVMSVLAFLGGAGGASRAGAEGDIPDDLKRQLAAEITQVLESSTPAE